MALQSPIAEGARIDQQEVATLFHMRFERVLRRTQAMASCLKSDVQITKINFSLCIHRTWHRKNHPLFMC